MRKLPYREGTWFAVPLEGGDFGVGVVARAAPKGKILLTYLFGPRRNVVPTMRAVEELKAKDAVLAIRISDLGLMRGTWPIIGHSESWHRSDWPMPLFIRHEGRNSWLVHYADDDPNRVLDEELAPPQPVGLSRDAVSGFGAAEFHLTMAISKAPNAKKTVNFMVHPHLGTAGRDVPKSFREEVLQQSRSIGSDTSLPHRLTLYLRLPTEAAAQAASEKARRLHFRSDVVPGSNKGTWLCRAKIIMIPDTAPLDRISACFEQLAFELHGEFDGWEIQGTKR